MRIFSLHGFVWTSATVPQAVPQHRRLKGLYLDALVTEHNRDADIETVMAHNSLLAAYVAEGDVLPVRYGTGFSSLASVRAALEYREHPNTRRLAKLSQAAEFGVKILRLPETRETDRPVETTPSGADYLRARMSARMAARQAATRQSTLIQTLITTLSQQSRDQRHCRSPQNGAPALTNTAFLVAHSTRHAFLAAAEAREDDLTAEGLALDVSGPWPAYNFLADRPAPKSGLIGLES